MPRPILYRKFHVVSLIGLFLLFLSLGVVASHIEMARSYWEDGDLQRSFRTLKGLLQEDPDNPEARLLFARVHLELANPAAAELEIERALDRGMSREKVLMPLGRALLDQRKIQRILDEIRVTDALEEALKVRIHTLRAEAFYADGRPGDGNRELAQAELLVPGHSAVLLLRAKVAFKQGDFKTAEALVREVLESTPEEADAWEMLGELHFSRQRFEPAEQAYTKAMESARNKWLVAYKRTGVRIALGDLDGAKADLAEASRVGPNFAGLLYARAMILEKEGKLAEAYEALDLFLSHVPGNLGALYLAGTVAFRQGNYEQARDHLDELHEKAPEDRSGAQMLGLTLIAQRKPEDAETLLAPFARNAEVDSSLLLAYTGALIAQRKYKQAREPLERLVAENPENDEIRIKLAQNLVRLGEIDAAEQAVATVLARHPANVEAHTLRMAISLMGDDSDDALTAARAFTEAVPDSPTALNALGMAHLKSQNTEAAQQAFRRALDHAPGFRDAAFNLAKLRLISGDREGARSYVQSILDTDPLDSRAVIFLAQLDDEPQTAADRLAKALEADPDAMSLRVALAQAHLAGANPTRAGEVLRAAPSAQSELPEILTLRGQAEMASGQTFQAVKTFETLVETQPRVALARYLLAEALARVNNQTEMQEQLLRALQLDPNHVRAEATLELVLSTLSDIASQYSLLGRAGEAAPDGVAVLSARAQIALKARDYARAVGFLKELGQTKPENRKYRFALAAAQRLAGQETDALETLSDWVERHPEDIKARLEIALLYITTGEREKAAAVYELVVEAEPENVVALNNLAELLRGNDVSRALQYAERAYAIEKAPQVGDTLGALLLVQGETDRATKILAQAYREMPSSSTIAFHYAEALASGGQRDSAKRILQKIEDGDFPERQEAQELLERLK